MKTKINFGNLVLVLLVIVLALLLFRECNKKVTPPITTPTVVQVQEQAKDEVINKAIADSFVTVINHEKNESAKWKLAYEDLMTDYLNAENDAQNVVNQKVPDTCAEYQRKVQLEIQKLKTTNANKDKAATNTIASLSKQNQTKDNFLKEKDRKYGQLKLRFDTCIFNAAINEKYIKKNKPKREISIGVSAMTNFADILKPAIGLGLGYRNKKGSELIINYYSNNIGTATLKIPLIKF